MTAGKRPFEGNTASDVRAAILLKEPTPLPLEAELPELVTNTHLALATNAAVR